MILGTKSLDLTKIREGVICMSKVKGKRAQRNLDAIRNEFFNELSMISGYQDGEWEIPECEFDKAFFICGQYEFALNFCFQCRYIHYSEFLSGMGSVYEMKKRLGGAVPQTSLKKYD